MKKITVCLDMRGCPNRCKHCWLGHFPNGHLGTNDLVHVANQFKSYTKELVVYSWLREPDYDDNYKELWQLENQLSVGDQPKRFELLSFYRLVRDPEYIKWASYLGIKQCQLTFFGMEELTDEYVGRKGAFQELLKATEILIDHDIAPRWQVFVNKQNIHEVKELITLSESLNLKERCEAMGETFVLFIHSGSCEGENEKLYDIRITDEDLKLIPDDIHYNVGEPECVLYERLLADHRTKNLVSDEPVFYITKDFNVYPNDSNIAPWWCLGHLETDGIEVILNNYQTNASLAQQTRLNVPVSELVRLCGNKTSRRLFDEEDYISYLLNQYCKTLI
ncbi:MAG: radical SAM protein [Turicibacter sp.]